MQLCGKNAYTALFLREYRKYAGWMHPCINANISEIVQHLFAIQLSYMCQQEICPSDATYAN